MENVLKVLLWIWMFIILIFGLRFLTQTIPITDTIEGFFKKEEKKVVTKKVIRKQGISKIIRAQLGFHINIPNSCEFNGDFYKVEDVEVLSSNKSCVNGNCSIDIEFKDKKHLPFRVGLYVEKDGECKLKKYIPDDYIQTIGYVLKLILTRIDKESLGMKYGDKLRLRNSTSHSITPTKTEFFYKTKLDYDTIMINGKEKGYINLILR